MSEAVFESEWKRRNRVGKATKQEAHLWFITGMDAARHRRSGGRRDEIREIKNFLRHIQNRVGEDAFLTVWQAVERLEGKV